MYDIKPYEQANQQEDDDLVLYTLMLLVHLTKDVHHREAMDDGEAADTYMRLGRCQAALGLAAAAIGSLEEVLKIRPGDPLALRQLADETNNGKWI